MTDSKAVRSARDRAAGSDGPDGWGEAFAPGRWIERAPVRARGQHPTSRHSAITRTLYSYQSYKSWADKVRSSFDPDDPEG